MSFVGRYQSMQQYASKIWVLGVSQGWVGCRAPNNPNFENIVFPCKNCLIQSCKILQDDLSGQTVISIVHPHPTTAQNFSYHIYAVFLKKVTLFISTITKSNVDWFQWHLVLVFATNLYIPFIVWYNMHRYHDIWNVKVFLKQLHHAMQGRTMQNKRATKYSNNLSNLFSNLKVQPLSANSLISFFAP